MKVSQLKKIRQVGLQCWGVAGGGGAGGLVPGAATRPAGGARASARLPVQSGQRCESDGPPSPASLRYPGSRGGEHAAAVSADGEGEAVRGGGLRGLGLQREPRGGL